ncbi:G-protein coupled receptor Mth2-like [Belonocnema kinseyi]|uniref:G-protein coupled receptor Mth2-like n=1 Tax=Belonocnema kinseyi TaxID=2817044 RepID=UPI00143DC24E|nr:G-protein coupled receptor Mth2-like [Belonocnema kinseyi]
MCHVGTLFVAYTCLAMINFDVAKSQNLAENENPTNKIMCATMGYMLLFAFISTFSWLNIMCFDIWWTFGNKRTPSGVSRNRKQRNKFIAYCCYSWGTALAITSLCILVDSTDILSVTRRPNIGRDRCWFQHGLGATELIFFTGPVTLQLTVNLLFFILTSKNYNKVKTQIRKVLTDPTDQRNQRFQGDREKLIMNVKLFIVMGISWICEVISNYLNYFLPWLLEYRIFLVFDIINCLQGVFIFALFTLKKKLYNALRRRFLTGNDKGSVSNTEQFC